MSETRGLSPRNAGALVFAVVGLAGACEGLYAAFRAAPSLWYAAAYAAVCLWAMTLWLIADCRARGLPVLFDQGLFVYLFSFIILPVHLLRTRGLKGLALVVAVVLDFYGAYVVTYYLSWAIALAFG